MRHHLRTSLYCLLIMMAALATVLIFATRSAAQFTTASLGGNVVDSSGAAIPGAAVRVQNTETGFSQTTSTGATGAYLFPRLPVGNYKLTVEKTGFTTYVQAGIVLTVNQAASQPVTLQVGRVTQEITVSANAELVQSRAATVGQLIDQGRIVDLPLNGREVQSLVFLAAGTTDVTGHYCGINCEGGVYPGEQYASVSGSMSNSVNYLLDGVDHNDTYINTNLPFPNPDAIEEFNIQTGNMSAEYGNAVGGVVNVVSKSGTNTIHGGVFEFLRNGNLNARNFFAPTHDTLKRNQFGASLGGPIKKDRLFFFGTYQGTRIRSAAEGQIAFVPTRAEREGDFSDLCPGGFDANGICADPNGTQLVHPVNRTPFLNNQIPTSDFSPVTEFFLNYIPEPNGPGRQLTYTGPSTRQSDDQFMVKIDYTRGKHQLNGRYFFTNFSQPPFIQKVNLIAADSSGNQVRVQNIGFSYTYNVTSNLMLNTWFGWNQQNGGSRSGAPFGFPDAGVKIAAPTPPELVIGVDGGFYISTNHYGAFNRGDQTFRENVTYVKGRHELHLGGEALRVRLPMANTFQQSGEFSFSDNLSNDNITDFMLGRASGFVQAGGIYLDGTGIKWSAFIQDNWRVNSRLTFNVGLRWDPYFPYQDSEGRLPCFVAGQKSKRYPNAPVGLLFAGTNHDPGCPPGSTYTNAGNLAPRLGFAYRLTEDGKTSLRGGAGYYYQPPNTVAIQDPVGIPPFAPTIYLSGVDFQDPYGSAGVPNPFPEQYGPRNPGPDATFPSNIAMNYILDRDFRLPQVLVWNLTLERQLGLSWVLRAAYVGNKGTYLYGTNDQESGMLAVNPAIYIPGQSTVANTQERRIYPDFAFINMITSGINSNYNALQLNLEKRVGHGLSLLTNYTWARQLNDFAPIGAWNSNTNPFNRHFDYGRSDDDLTSVFKFSGTYQFPRTAMGGVAGKLLNGWQLNSILTWQGGFPFPIFSGYDNSFSGIGADRADFVGTDLHAAQLSSGRPHGEQIQKWFDTSLFVPNAIGTFGNTGKNILRGPKLFNTDLGLLKDTKITERTKLQFRAEFFNAFNNVNFDIPDHTVTDDAFGQITGARSPRILQFALKFEF